MDHLQTDQRSALMGRVRGSNTKPEMTVRRIAHRLGFRFRLHRRDLPGSPDIVLPKHRLAIFVHGCFWHRHTGCRRASSPATNKIFWEKKFERNIERDAIAVGELEKMGWRSLVIWECEVRNFEHVVRCLNEATKSSD